MGFSELLSVHLGSVQVVPGVLCSQGQGGEHREALGEQ